MSDRLLEATEWCTRCARRVRDIDPELSESEALEIAHDFNAFERTAKMEPEAAADFVHTEMGQDELPRFERRSGSRSDRSLIERFIGRSSPALDGSQHS